MLIEQHAHGVVVRAPAKVNLFLEIVAKRADGYHEIATLMAAVSLYDTLELKDDASGKIQLECSNRDLSAGPENLVCRAAALLQQRSGPARGCSIRLTKNIPLAAGLAGGSTDAAATLAGLNELWQLGVRTEDLARYGALLGSDVPFFFDTPAAWCTGRGEEVVRVDLGAEIWLVVVSPPYGLSTALVYRGVTVPREPETGTGILQAAREGNVAELGQRLFNRLQAPALALRPEMNAIGAGLTALGPAGVAMSGSGSSWFALCRNQSEAQRIAHEFRARSSPEKFRVEVVHSTH
jgi:4-diphosphocytidyl-2-C-methyl-D-erythritol kinase